MLADRLRDILDKLPSDVCLVAVSKYHTAEKILEAYEAGQRVFGESRPQEFHAKAACLPKDICWHFIGHLQTNKLKLVLQYVSLVESVDSVHLLESINAWSLRSGKVTDVLLEVHVSREETKSGLSEEEVLSVLSRSWDGVRIRGLMGMATNTEDEDVVCGDFRRLSEFKKLIGIKFPNLEHFDELSMGMSGDWPLAIRYGATIVRIGTAIFGERTY